MPGMMCFFARRRFIACLDGDMRPRALERLNKHLARCPACRAVFADVQSGHQAARQFGRAELESFLPSPEFAALWALVKRKAAAQARPARTARSVLRELSMSPATALVMTFVLAGAALLLMSQRRTAESGEASPAVASRAGDLGNFTPLRIAEFAPGTRSRVVTEGVVGGVYFDEKEKTLHIKLVERDQKPEPFVICEVRSRDRMTIPQEGSHVRVYGMARFDSQPGRRWNEVNPVTNIDILKH